MRTTTSAPGSTACGWPDEKYYGSSAAYPEYFTGDISDVAFWDRQLTDAEALTLYPDGTTAAALLTKLTRPSGSVYAQVAYDPLTNRVTSDTDSNGGTWQLHPPTASGSSQVYVASVLAADPARLLAAERHRRHPGRRHGQLRLRAAGPPATYYGVTEGVTGTGPFTDQPVDSLHRHGLLPGHAASASTTGGPAPSGCGSRPPAPSEVLSPRRPARSPAQRPSGYDPVLYVGSGREAKRRVLDGNSYHRRHVVGGGQRRQLALRGARGRGDLPVAVRRRGAPGHGLRDPGRANPAWTNVAAGAGFIGGNWPDTSATGATAELVHRRTSPSWPGTPRS